MMVVTIDFLDILAIAVIMFYIGMMIWGAHTK